MAQVNNNNDIKYLTPIAVDTKRKKYCRFKKNRIKYIDYKDADFLLAASPALQRNTSARLPKPSSVPVTSP